LPKKGNLLHYAARLSEKQRKEVAQRLQAGETVSGLAREFDADRAIIIRARKAA
jgi:transposase-like protein